MKTVAAKVVPAVQRPDFDDYVAARSASLLRTAYLLTQDSQLAEDLVQTALTKAWFAWRRIEGDPGPYVTRVLVNTYVSGWRRKWRGELPTEELPDAGYADPADASDLKVALRRPREGSARSSSCGTSRTSPRARPRRSWAARSAP